MPLDLFETLSTLVAEPVTDVKDLNSELGTSSTMACCEEGQCCDTWST